MLTREELHNKIANGLRFLDGATGSNLRLAGMPKGCCTEQWILENPLPLVKLQRAYAQSGSQIIYAPTFQAQPIALQTVGLERQTEAINAALVSLSRSAAPDCLIAGDLTTLTAFCDSWNPDNFDLLVANYRRQIKGLIDGGCDLLVGETLLYPQEQKPSSVPPSWKAQARQCIRSPCSWTAHCSPEGMPVRSSEGWKKPVLPLWASTACPWI